jgi:hypothetical protein
VQAPTWATAAVAVELVGADDPRGFVLVTVTEIVEPMMSGSSAKHRVGAVAPVIFTVVPLLVLFH